MASVSSCFSENRYSNLSLNSAITNCDKIAPSRRKSGERAASSLRYPRSASAPAACREAKTVHFGEIIEQIRLFAVDDSPRSVSFSSVPCGEEDDNERRSGTQQAIKWDIATNITEDADKCCAQHVNVKMLALSMVGNQRTLEGMVTVANIAYEKFVAVRFTFDDWYTVSEVSASYLCSVVDTQTGALDTFKYAVEIPDCEDLADKALLLCAQYRVNGEEFWDNNSGHNYRVTFRKSALRCTRTQPARKESLPDLHSPTVKSEALQQSTSTGLDRSLAPFRGSPKYPIPRRWSDPLDELGRLAQQQTKELGFNKRSIGGRLSQRYAFDLSRVPSFVQPWQRARACSRQVATSKLTHPIVALGG